MPKDKEDILIDMMENGCQLSEHDLQTIESDEELNSMMQEVLMASACIRARRNPVDVEQQLASFKLQHTGDDVIDEKFSSEKTEKKSLVLRVMPFLLVAAAIFVCIFLLFRPSSDKGLLYEADLSSPKVEIESENGEIYELSSQKKEASTLANRNHVIDAGKISEPATIVIPYGQEATIHLADGSKVHLHPGSKLRFPNKFVGKERVVSLEGEAYFEVTHNPRKPFVVEISQGFTKVWGTEFDVTAFDGQPVSVTLVKGKVEVNLDKNKRVLSPGQKAMLADNGQIQTSMVDTEPYTMWRDGYLYYDNVPLDEILEDIGKNYNVSISCNAAQIHQIRMRFMLKRSDSIHEVISAINEMQKVKASLGKDGVVYISLL